MSIAKSYSHFHPHRQNFHRRNFECPSTACSRDPTNANDNLSRFTRLGVPDHQSASHSFRFSQEQLMCFLWIIGHNSSNREAQEQFQHSGETISRYFQSVLRGMLALYKKFVRLPPDSTPTRIRNDWGKMSYFQNFRGAIDGTHILAHVPTAQQAPYRKMFLLAAVLTCTFSMSVPAGKDQPTMPEF